MTSCHPLSPVVQVPVARRSLPGHLRHHRPEVAMRVLVIEDDDSVRSAVRRALLLDGYEVLARGDRVRRAC